MGVECCYAAINKKRVPEGSLQWYIAKGTDKASIIAGFSSFQVSKDGMIVIYYDQVNKLKLFYIQNVTYSLYLIFCRLAISCTLLLKWPQENKYCKTMC